MLKKWFLLTMIVMPSLFFLMIPVVPEFWETAEYYYIDDMMESKAHLFARNSDVIIAGDSRAHFGLDPKHIKKKTGKSAVNVSAYSVGPVMQNDNLKVNDVDLKNTTLIINVSAFSLNDGVKRPTYYSNAIIRRLSIIERFEQFYPDNIETLIKYASSSLKYKIKSSVSEDKFIGSLGFNAANGSLKKSDIRPSEIKGAYNKFWYQNWGIHGHKRKHLESAIKELKDRSKKIILIQMPLSDSFKKHSGHLWEEVEMQAELSDIARIYNIEFISFLDNKSFSDDDFFDLVHLNSQGANRLTTLLLKNTTVAE